MNLIFLSEWNKGAIFFVFILFLIPVIIVYFLLWGVLKNIPFTKLYVDKLKEEKRTNYRLTIILVFIISFALTYGILGLTYYIRGQGLLE